MGGSTVLTIIYLFISFSSARPPPDYYNFYPQNTLRDDLFTSIEYRHNSLSYKAARQQLFGHLFLKGLSFDTYSVLTTYCQITVTNKDLSTSNPLAPLQIPDSQIVNTEHSWPQSKFSSEFSESLQKGDLHILFPELSNVNSLRSNHPYGIVTSKPISHCPGAALGKSASGRTVFEPHDRVKGDVARALFYFSVRYKQAIDREQEDTLRQWHVQDPIDADEETHNDQVFELQNNRNPFIDNPAWVEQIQDF